MKQRHIITLAIIATSIGCTSTVPDIDRDDDTRSSEPQDTTSTGTPPEAEDWEVEMDTTFTITGTPVD